MTFTATATETDAKGRSTLTVRDETGEIVFSTTGTRAAKATHVSISGNNPETEGGAYWLGRGVRYSVGLHTRFDLAAKDIEQFHRKVRGIDPTIVEVAR